ncbi:MAG: NADH-quinone oxidoreductase subunit NuoE [Spirochaetia bacterium]|jgi:NADH-quinone oxidoreductase subunit E
MLSELDKKRIEEEARLHEHRRTAVSDALLIAQESRGWVSDEAIAEVAGLLGMSREEVEGIATFYELIFRQPVGRHVVMVCDSVSCWITGEERILDHLTQRLGIGLGGTTPDGAFTLLPVGCLGACDAGPAIMVDGKLYGNLTPARADEILALCGLRPQTGKAEDAEASHG